MKARSARVGTRPNQEHEAPLQLGLGQDLFLRWQRRMGIVMRLAWVALASVAGVALIQAYSGKRPDMGFWLIAVSVVLLFLWQWFASMRALPRERTYRRLSAKMSTDGVSRCVWCGSKGIRRQGKYRSKRVTCFCARCDKALFLAR